MALAQLLLSVLIAFGIGLCTAQLTETEELLLAQPNQGRIYEHLAFLTARPHIAGSQEDYDTALYVAAALQRAGIDVRIEPLNVTLSFPISRSLEIVAPTDQLFHAVLKEDAIPEDPTSYDDRAVMTYNAFSASGNVTGQVIYVNYGREEDHQELERMGISVAGKIVLVRYGGCFRGNKAFAAEKRGALGLLIYSDPAEDVLGTVYPNGPWRPPTSVQRGSLAYSFICPGDNGKPERCGNVKSTPSIPVLPLSYADAQPLLSGLTGFIAPSAWQGGLPFTYKIGPGPIVANLVVNMKLERKEVWNVIGEIPGQVFPDRRIILGNHRDAWTFGAVDPSSGTSSMLELARSFSALLASGWRPKRTIQFSSWDAEEFSLTGSVEFGETNSVKLSAEAITYINVDSAASGSLFSSSASPSLYQFIRDATTEVTDPKTGKPLSSVWSGDVGRLGSGSDWVVFLNKLGISSLDLSFGSGNFPVYHSNYDSLTWMQKFGDPGFAYHKLITQLWGLLTLRLADATVLPFNYVDLTTNLKLYLSEIQQLLRDNGGENQVDLELIAESIAAFETAAGVSQRAREFCLSSATACSSSELAFLNDHLYLAERRFLSQNGLPRRPFFKHVVFAPGITKGYDVSVFPGLVDAIQEKQWAEAESQAEVLAAALRDAAEYLIELNVFDKSSQ